MSEDIEIKAFFGHHKCATTWIRGIIGYVAGFTGDRVETYDTPRNFRFDLPAYIKERKVSFFAFTNADITFLEGLPPFRGFHVIRDPRDVIVSAYFSHLNSHPTEGWPELVAHRAKLQGMSEDEGIIEEMDFTESVLREMESWDYDQPHVLEIRFENLIRNPYTELLAAFNHMGLIDTGYFTATRRLSTAISAFCRRLRFYTRGRFPLLHPQRAIPGELLLGEVYRNRFSRITGGREEGQEDRQSHYRKGTPGDWRIHFSEKCKASFKRKFGGLLAAVGYEPTDDW